MIDLAVLRLHSPIPPSAIDKAEKTYEVMRPLKDAVQSFQTRLDFRDKCFKGLQINSAQIPKVIDGIDLLATDLGLSNMDRTF